MNRLILLMALGGDQAASDLCERIGGVVASIEQDARIYAWAKVNRIEAENLLTIEMLGAGLINEWEATQRNTNAWRAE